MNIAINKDLEKEYKNDLVMGFDPRECIYILIALIELIGIAVLLYIKTGFSATMCAYAGMPLALPTLILGFKKFHGMSCFRYIKEILWERRTRILTYEAEEFHEDIQVFTLDKRKRGAKK